MSIEQDLPRRRNKVIGGYSAIHKWLIQHYSMNQIENDVPSLELCKQLKTLGFPQEGRDYWKKIGHYDWELTQNPTALLPQRGVGMIVYLAPSIGQMIRWVEESANEWACGYNDCGVFYHFMKGPRGTGNMINECCQKSSKYCFDTDADVLKFADAISSWLIHLAEQGLINPKELEQ